MPIRYQIFISSTYLDLQQERQEVIQALLEADYIPSGMELFNASNDAQFEYIKKVIDDCDYYVLIIGGRYGSLNPRTGKSFTEQEYDYALERGIPILAFIHKEPEKFPTEFIDSENTTKLENFRNKVRENRVCKMWVKEGELARSIITSLNKELKTHPQPGWIRGGLDIDSQTQIKNLVNENNLLTQQVELLKKQINDQSRVENLSWGTDIITIKGIMRHDGSEYPIKHELTWDEVFSCVGPYLIAPVSYARFCSDLKKSINDYISESNRIAFSEINSNIIQTIKVQLVALGYITYYSATNTSNALMEFVQITPFGAEYLTMLKTIKRT